MSGVLEFEGHLRRSIELAHLAVQRGDHPFGAVLLSAEGEMIAEGMNAVPSTGDVRAHAELEAVVNARRLGPAERVPGGIMIASGEPCPMCATGMVWAGLSRIVFAAAVTDFTQYLAPGPRFGLRCKDILDSASVDIQLEGPVDGVGALEPFQVFAARN
ncbi:nucleoside deaminase [Kineosporia babensis]|uniref:Nucleoside deaminase n=1 Tax=Kineosporia babensis TaxID=499548 RepID=A0A9X1SRD2_9ACTN|nr:nucleoside deaminase [Kineosporia babensis]MCD5309522.1 nucleoside deaminase [Kineosporia babensis]